MRLGTADQRESEANLWWDHDAGALAVDKSADGLTDLRSLSATLRARSPRPRNQLTELERKILDRIAENVREDRCVSGRRLRRDLEPVPSNAVNRALDGLCPRYVAKQIGSSGDEYEPTLLGLLQSPQTGPISKLLDDTLRAIAHEYETNPDIRAFSWAAVVEMGGWSLEQDQKLASKLYRIAGLGQRQVLEKGAWFWDVPEDIEQLRRCKDLSSYFAYARTQTDNRPWPSCPLSLPEDPSQNSVLGLPMIVGTSANGADENRRHVTKVGGEGSAKQQRDIVADDGRDRPPESFIGPLSPQSIQALVDVALGHPTSGTRIPRRPAYLRTLLGHLRFEDAVGNIPDVEMLKLNLGHLNSQDSAEGFAASSKPCSIRGTMWTTRPCDTSTRRMPTEPSHSTD